MLKVNMYSKLQDGNIPLFAAVEAGNIHVCRELLLQETESQLKYTKPPLKDLVLHLAARKRDNDMVKLFIEAGAVVDGTNVRIALRIVFLSSQQQNGIDLLQLVFSNFLMMFQLVIFESHGITTAAKVAKASSSTFSSQSRLFCFLDL